MPYEISTEGGFSAAHFIEGYEGDCARLHGHNWRVRVTIRSEGSGGSGLTYDFRKLKGLIAEVAGKVDHSALNDLPFFQGVNPTAENIAAWFYRELQERIGDTRVMITRVEVWESDVNCAAYLRE